MTTPQGMLELADKIGTALERYLCANNSATKVVEELELQRIFWDNKAGIVAYLRQAAAPQGREALDIKPSIYGYQYHDCIRFDGGGREVNGSRPTGAVPFYDQATIDRLVAALTPAVAPDGAGEAIIEKCAIVCDKHAQWAEDKIEDDPASTRSQIFATISNTANDCAEMIRDLTRLPVDYSGEVTKAQVHQVNELVRPEFEKGHWVDVESEAALAQAQEPGEGKPVAWNCIYPNRGHITLRETEAEQALIDGATVVPLFAHPPLAQAQEPGQDKP